MSKTAENPAAKSHADLAPFEIWEVMLDNSTIKFHEPLRLKPRILDRGTPGECFYAEHTELDISAVAVSLDELVSCLRSDIRMIWKHVVQKQDNELTPDDQMLKRRWLAIAEEINDG